MPGLAICGRSGSRRVGASECDETTTDFGLGAAPLPSPQMEPALADTRGQRVALYGAQSAQGSPVTSAQGSPVTCCRIKRDCAARSVCRVPPGGLAPRTSGPRRAFGVRHRRATRRVCARIGQRSRSAWRHG